MPVQINENNYFVVQGWMISELNLKTSELMIFAIIYGFSQDGESTFDGSADYLAKWTNTSRRNVMDCLSSLVNKGYIEKSEFYKNGVKYVSYAARRSLMKRTDFTPYEETSQGGVKKLHRGYEETSHNNIDDNIADISLRETNKENEPIPYDKIIGHLNMRIGTNYSSSARTTVKHIHARWMEGFRLEDFITVIDKKTVEWIQDPKMNKYLRPETLFGTKFEGYLNQIVTEKKQTLNDIDVGDMSEFMDFGGEV